MLSPDWRVTVPTVGSIAPVISLNSVVLPVPFRPTIPHRSPEVTVKVTSRKRVVAPKSTPAPPTEICVIARTCPSPSGSWGHPALPGVFGRSHGQRVPLTDQGHAQQQGLVDQDREPALVAV